MVNHVVLDLGLFLKDYETLYEAEIPVLSEKLLNSFQLDLLLVVYKISYQETRGRVYRT